MEAPLAAVHGSQLRGAWPLDLAKDDVVWLSLSVPRLEANTTLDSYMPTWQFAAIAPHQPVLFLAISSRRCTPYHFVLCGFPGPRLGVHDVLISPTSCFKLPLRASASSNTWLRHY
ncbi:uncharacterized protein TrAtP1_000554 [Trichoderma atroviride]|uniref:Uncharacterized protein n=1 Tax=Hypocrea atroviridis (strain ATCC 20476 / IMI 206040) TaxID=452589 RepID=G9NJ14_HYPAI|nr:uncharacterized protein TRIATDRAFT_304767 [Trichoderma atroviride IMI 206040]EHK48891.1 hypothetical protein TRIATDRAFT_304767 [Trichoderma atroviride IMI 206040]UKZ59237.1 hypothetical protein TrAtP1_000554 [Trichoderma atroviride]